MLRNSGQYMLAQWLDTETRSVAAGVVEERRMQFESRAWAAMYDVDIRDRGRKLVADLAAVDQLLANFTSGAVVQPHAQVGQLRARLDALWLNGLPELHRKYICLLSPRYYIDLQLQLMLKKPDLRSSLGSRGTIHPVHHLCILGPELIIAKYPPTGS